MGLGRVVGGGAELMQRVGPDRLTRGNGLRELVIMEAEIGGHLYPVPELGRYGTHQRVRIQARCPDHVR